MTIRPLMDAYRIVDLHPSLKPALAEYEAAVDAARARLTEELRAANLTEALRAGDPDARAAYAAIYERDHRVALGAERALWAAIDRHQEA